MASSLLSLEAVASPEKFGSSIIHLCRSVKRTVSGSVSGWASVKLIAMSSMSSQSNVGGTLLSLSLALIILVIQFFGVVLVPFRNFYHDVRGSVGNCLAAEARFLRDARSHIQFVKFGVGGFVAGFEALSHDDVAGGAGADSAASVIETGFDAFGRIENAAGQAIVAIRNFLGIELNRFAAGKKGDSVFLRRRL